MQDEQVHEWQVDQLAVEDGVLMEIVSSDQFYKLPSRSTASTTQHKLHDPGE